MSLERIRELLTEPDANDVPFRPKWAGIVEVWSHLHIADDVDLKIEPNRAGLASEELRAFLRQVMEAYTALTKEKQ